MAVRGPLHDEVDGVPEEDASNETGCWNRNKSCIQGDVTRKMAEAEGSRGLLDDRLRE